MNNIINYLINTYNIIITDYYNKTYLFKNNIVTVEIQKYNLIKYVDYEILKNNGFVINNTIIIDENLLNNKLCEYLLFNFLT